MSKTPADLDEVLRTSNVRQVEIPLKWKPTWKKLEKLGRGINAVGLAVENLVRDYQDLNNQLLQTILEEQKAELLAQKATLNKQRDPHGKSTTETGRKAKEGN